MNRLARSIGLGLAARGAPGSLAETATVLGRPEGTIKAQVHRGLRRLRLALAAESPAEVPALAETTELTA